MSILNKTFQTKYGYFLVASLFVTSPILLANEDKNSNTSEVSGQHDHEQHDEETTEKHADHEESSKEEDHDHGKDEHK